MLKPEGEDYNPDLNYGSCGMDASMNAVAYACHVTRELVIMPIPAVLRAMLVKVMAGEKMCNLTKFTIAIFEYFCVPAAQFQWGARWKQLEIDVVNMFIDNDNAKHWINSGFSSSSIGQDLCRVTGGLEFAYRHQAVGIRTPTHLNETLV